MFRSEQVPHVEMVRWVICVLLAIGFICETVFLFVDVVSIGNFVGTWVLAKGRGWVWV